MQRQLKRQNSNIDEDDAVVQDQSKATCVSDPEAPKSIWHLNLSTVRACFPNRPQDTLHDLDDIFDWLATTPLNARPIPPGTYQVSDIVELKLDCYAIVRFDIYDRLKIDLFNTEMAVATSRKAKLADVTTVNCIDPDLKIFEIKPDSKYLAKQTSLSFEKSPAAVEKYAESYDIKDDPSLITYVVTTEVNNMQEVGLNKVKGPYFLATTGSTAGIHGFFTMRKIEGEDLFNRIARDEFKSYEKLFEIMLRCLHAADQQIFQYGKLHLDIKLENFMSSVYRTNPARMRVKMIDGETLHDISATSAKIRIGTHGYIAPELAKHRTITPTTDVYSLGMMMRLICRDVNARYYLCSLITEELITQMETELELYGWIRPNIQLQNLTDTQVSQGLYNWLRTMTLADPALRYSNSQCIEEFEKLYTQFRVSRCQGDMLEEKRKAVSAGIVHGLKFAKYYREASTRELGMKSENFTTYAENLINMIIDAKKAQGCFFEFQVVIDDAQLFGCSNHQHMIDRIVSTVNTLRDALTSWNALSNEISALADNEYLLSEYNLFFEVIRNTPVTLENLHELAKHIMKKEQFMRDISGLLKPQATNAQNNNVEASTVEESPTKKSKSCLM